MQTKEMLKSEMKALKARLTTLYARLASEWCDTKRATDIAEEIDFCEARAKKIRRELARQ